MPATISRRLPASPALPLSHSTKRSARPFHPNHPNRPHRYDHLPTTTPPRPSAASAAPFIIPRAIFTLCNGRAWHHLRWRWLVTRPGSIRRVSHDASSSSSCRSSDGGRHWAAALPLSVERALHRNPPRGRNRYRHRNRFLLRLSAGFRIDAGQTQSRPRSRYRPRPRSELRSTVALCARPVER